MAHEGHPEFIRTAPLEVATKPDELKQYYENRSCCFAGLERDHWVDIIACECWQDLPYYVGYYNVFSKENINDSQFSEKLIMLEGVVVDIKDIPELKSEQSIVLIHRDNIMTDYAKLDDFISVIEALYHDPELGGDFDELVALIGCLKGMKWKEQLIKQSKYWATVFEKQRAVHRMLRMSEEVGEING